MIFLLTDIEKGTGMKPTIQDEKHWQDEGYIHTAYESENSKTLCKQPFEGDNHCGFLPVDNSPLVFKESE